MRRIRRPAVTAIIGLVALAVAAQPSLAASGGQVLPAHLAPAGYSLTEMAKQMALFTTSGNDAAYYPQTPFQILYARPGTTTTQPEGGGLLFTGRNTFIVCPGTMFFQAILNVSDSPPVPGTFPTTPAQAKAYFFDRSQLGTRAEVVVDGQVMPVGPAFVAGPVTTPPLLNGGGTHIVTLGAFLAPMTTGAHVVSIRAGFFGELVDQSIGSDYFREVFTYTVIVNRVACR